MEPLIPIVQFTVSETDNWHPNTTFGVSSDGRILILLDMGWQTSCYHDEGSIQHQCLQALCTQITRTHPKRSFLDFRSKISEVKP